MNGTDGLSSSGADVIARYFQLSLFERNKVSDIIFRSAPQQPLPLFAAPVPTIMSPVWADTPPSIREPPVEQQQAQQAQQEEDAENNQSKWISVCSNEKCKCCYYFTKEELENGTVPELQYKSLVVFGIRHPEDAEEMEDKELCKWVMKHVSNALAHIAVERMWVRRGRRVVDLHFATHPDAARAMLRLRSKGFSVNWMRARTKSGDDNQEYQAQEN